MKGLFLNILLILFLAVPARAALRKDLAAAGDLIYSARFEEAEKRLLKIQEASPRDVAPAFFLAVGKLGEIAFKGEDEASLSELDRRIEECCALSEEKLSGEAEGETCLFAGASFLLRSSMEARRERYGEALFWAKKALLLFRKAAETPECAPDAVMLKAAYDCVCASAPWPLNLGLDWIVSQSNVQNDLALIEEQLPASPVFEREMRIFLIFEYSRLGYPSCALGHLKKLRSSLKDSPFLDIIALRTDMSAGNRRGAYAAATNLYAKTISRKSHKPLRADAAFLAGSAAFSQGNVKEAEKWFEITLKEGGLKPRAQAAAQLMLGKCADARGEREEALRRYALVHLHKGASPVLKSLTTKLQRSPGDPRQTIY